MNIVLCRSIFSAMKYLGVLLLHAEETEVPPFHVLMKKVVFVLSGFENPERSSLRDKAIEMGAMYKPDWSKACTHLM